jgi:magnesium chelatase family protein
MNHRNGGLISNCGGLHRMTHTLGRARLCHHGRERYLSEKLHGCPCGYAGDPEHDCPCSSTLISRYQKRLSGPLLDRIDIHVDVPRVPFQKLTDERRGEPSAAVRGRVEAARGRQRQRLAGTKLTANADMGPTHIRELCHLDDTARQLLGSARRQMNLSARAHHPF